MVNTQTVCNWCGNLLYGKHGTTFVKKPYIYIKGRICWQNLGEGDKKYFQFVTTHDEEETTVCNMECLAKHVDQRQKQRKDERIRGLRIEAGRNWLPKG